jgi:pyridoxamine 5'-phosphate oxidase-like protein
MPPAASGPAAWPPELNEVFHRSITAEFATLTRAGSPVTVPTTPYIGPNGATIDVSTGLTYPAKAERARRDPRVCLLFADPVGDGMDSAPVVLVQGLATVRDADLQANTDRYVRVSSEKLPGTVKGQPRIVLRRMGWYYARIWVEITPIHITWWHGRDLAEHPQTWEASPGTAAPLSDPAPTGSQPPPWRSQARPWSEVAGEAAGRLDLHDLTVVGPNGFPMCVPAARTERTADGFRLELGAGAPSPMEGPACLTMHTHAEVFTGQENRTFVGTASRRDGHVDFLVERALADWSLGGGRAQVAGAFLGAGRHLRSRLRAEAKRRFQPIPRVRFPSDR